MTDNEQLAYEYRTAQRIVHMMLDGLTETEWLHQPVPGANCAAWIIGHLTDFLRGALLKQRITDLPDLPAGLKDLVVTTAKPAGPQSGFGPVDELRTSFDAHLARYVAWIQGLTAEQLAEPFTALGPLARTYLEALHFGAMHIGIHAGQLSTIRRSLGKPPLV